MMMIGWWPSFRCGVAVFAARLPRMQPVSVDGLFPIRSGAQGTRERRVENREQSGHGAATRERFSGVEWEKRFGVAAGENHDGNMSKIPACI